MGVSRKLVHLPKVTLNLKFFSAACSQLSAQTAYARSIATQNCTTTKQPHLRLREENRHHGFLQGTCHCSSHRPTAELAIEPLAQENFDAFGATSMR